MDQKEVSYLFRDWQNFTLYSKFPKLLKHPIPINICLKPSYHVNNLVPDTEDEEDNSIIEGPKPTEEEAEKIAEDVDQALEENFKELEKKCVVDKNGVTNGNDAKMETDENDGAKMSCVEKNGVDEKEKSKKTI